MRRAAKKILRFCVITSSVAFFSVSVLTYIYPAEMISFANVGVSARVGSGSPLVQRAPKKISAPQLLPADNIAGEAAELAFLIYLVMFAFAVFSLLVILDYYADIYFSKNKYEISDQSFVIKKQF